MFLCAFPPKFEYVIFRITLAGSFDCSIKEGRARKQASFHLPTWNMAISCQKIHDPLPLCMYMYTMYTHTVYSSSLSQESVLVTHKVARGTASLQQLCALVPSFLGPPNRVHQSHVSPPAPHPKLRSMVAFREPQRTCGCRRCLGTR